VIVVHRTVLLACLIVLTFNPAATADPQDMVFVRPVAEFHAIDENGATVAWLVPEVPGTNPSIPLGYNIYRSTPETAAADYVQPPTPLGFVAFREGEQVYSFVDSTYQRDMMTIYHVRAVFEGDVVGLPSNPVADYPYCDWLYQDDEIPFMHLVPACLVP
jgi:hypothetical protein